MITTPSCAVSIAGVTVDDGSTDPDSTLFALSGLSLTWGRATTVDQPDTSTVTFDIADYTGHSTFTELAALGQVVDVYAVGTEWSDELVQTMPDPGMDDPAAGNITTWHDTTATVAGGRLSVHRHSQTYVYGTFTGTWVAMTPAPPDDVDPAAWDDIPTTALGQTWQIRVGPAVAGPGMSLRVGVALLDSPADTVMAHFLSGKGITWRGWPDPTKPFRWDYPVSVAGKWVAVAIRTAELATWDTAPAGQTWDTVTGTWDDRATFTVDDVTASVPGAGTSRSVLVFSGRITDAAAVWDESAGACITTVVAADLSADLANRDVGADPWPVHTVAARVDAILAGADVAPTVRIDPAVAGIQLTRMDVDRQPAYPMLADVATSVDAVLWTAGHVLTGPYLWVESLHARHPVLTLSLADGVAVIVPVSGDTAVIVSACSLDLDPVTWIQTNADVATRVVVTWQDQTTTPDTTERTLTRVRTDMETATNRFGVRRVSLSSQLTNADDAGTVADDVLARMSRAGSWRVGGLQYTVPAQLAPDEITTILNLLDGTRRIGAAILITDLPAWSPVAGDSVGGYVEGGRYDYDDGAWTMDLMVSNGDGIGAGATWDQMPAGYTWDTMGALTWDDMAGVAAPAGG